jgi:hypothetical protein
LNTPESITFFYPSRIVGGAEYLFVRMARYISKTATIPVYVIDYKDGFLRQQLKGTNVRVLEYTDKKEVEFNYDTTVVTSFNHLFKTAQFNVNRHRVKVFFWSIHPTHFTAYFPNRNWFLSLSDKQELASCFKEMIQHQSMVFMDAPNYQENATLLNFSVNEVPYLPIPCDTYSGTEKHYQKNEYITICWLGRIAVDKVNSIINVARHISDLPYEIKERINFIIIGNGEEEDKLIAELNRLQIKYECKGTILNEELNKFLIEHIDIGVAMGTSTLEFAKLKIPVVLVDVFTDSIPKNNKFQWLYSARDFSLGSYYSPMEMRNLTMMDIIETGYNEDSYNRNSQMCYRYYMEHHEMKASVNKLLDYLSNDNMRIDDPTLEKINKIMNPWYFRLMKRMKKLYSTNP